MTISAPMNLRLDTGQEKVAPVLSSVLATPSSSGVTITWTTAEASDSQVVYGLTSEYGTYTTLDVNKVTSHTVSISGLSSITTYYYRVRSRDAALNLGQSSGLSFTTQGGSDPVGLLTELITRRTRQAAGVTWGARYPDGTDLLEDRTANYNWQPDSVMYTDNVTGNEVWVMARNPGEHYDNVLYTNEHGSYCWSHNGAILSFNNDSALGQAYGRWSQNPAAAGWGDAGRPLYIVRSDGSCLRGPEGKGCNSIYQQGGLPWAQTEQAYYGLSSTAAFDGGGSLLYKNVVADNNVVTISNGGAPILDLMTATGGQQSKGFSTRQNYYNMCKASISNDDQYMVVGSSIVEPWGRIVSPCRSIIYIRLNAGSSPSIISHWGIVRPCAGYGGYDPTTEGSTFHSGSTLFVDPVNGYIVSQYENSGQWWKFKLSGTDTDGGPLWENWDGDSYGNNEIYPLSWSYQDAEPPGPYQFYWGHPCIDRWGKYLLLGESTENPGTRITEWDTGIGFDGSLGLVDKGMNSLPQPDGRHHSWSGWCDCVVWHAAVDNVIQSKITYARFVDFSSLSLGPVWPVFKGRSDNETAGATYFANIRPIQSPDGTKIAYHSYLLNTDTISSILYGVYVGWAVAYYPFPAVITGATQQGASVRLAFSPRNYTTRTYNGSAVEPKEIKYWHVWKSADKSTWTEVTTTGVPFSTRIYDVAQGDETSYYSITSEEHSRLESRRLGNIWKVVKAGGSITQSVEDTVYPSRYSVKAVAVSSGGSGYSIGNVLTISGGTYLSQCQVTVSSVSSGVVTGVSLTAVGAYSIIPQQWPTGVTGGGGVGATFKLTWNRGAGEIQSFYTTEPDAPTGMTATARSTAGHYLVQWTEPSGSKIRYYNIYYGTSAPSADPAFLIASVPVGTNHYLDWCAHATNPGYYKVTSVDRQGNEST